MMSLKTPLGLWGPYGQTPKTHRGQFPENIFVQIQTKAESRNVYPQEYLNFHK